MQSLPITTTTQPVTPAQAPNPADNNSAQAAETFDNVLARQRASAGESNKGQPASTASSTDSASAATGNELEAPIPDVISTLPGDMLAALLPASVKTKSVATHEKPVAHAPTPDGISTLPSDMLAALLSTPTTVGQDASPPTRQQPAATDVLGGTRQQPAATDVLGGTRQQPAATDVLGGTRQQPAATDVLSSARQQPAATAVLGGTRQQPAATDVLSSTQQQPATSDILRSTRQQPATSDVLGGTRQQPTVADVLSGTRKFTSADQAIGEQTATSLFHAQSNTLPTVAVTDTTQGKTFTAVLEALGKDAAATALSAGATQTSVQAALPDAIVLASLTQSTTSPIAVSQNGPVQVAVNTPVTHDAWGNEFNQKITWIATQHEQTAELHLNPPHLGPLDVVLNISGDQATALFTSPHAAVREAVEQALPKLREMLADNGIMLGNATVNDQSPKEQQAGQADKQRGGNASLPGKVGDAVPASGTVWPARRHQGMVDTFA